MANIKRNVRYDKIIASWKAKQYKPSALAELQLSESTMEGLAKYLSNYYYNDTPLVSDEAFDTLFNTLKSLYPQNEFVKNSVRAPVVKSKTKRTVKLKSYMSSLDKIYPGDGIETWVHNNGAPTINLSDKLDGFSLELAYDYKGRMTLTSGGDGVYGQDLSHLLQYMDLPSKPRNLVVRCEGVMIKSKHSKFASLFKTPRSALSNVFNSAKPNMDAVKATRIVALEIISPSGLNISAQYKKLESMGFEVPVHKNISQRTFTEDYIRAYYKKRKLACPYLIDGIVVNANTTYVLPKSGYPKHAVAFKENSSDSIVEATVVEVQGNVSRTGRIVPLVIIDPVVINGVTVTNVTGHNYGYIRDNKINVGSKIKITRSGEVIPYIVSVIKKAKEGALPNGEEGEDWYWETDLDIKVLAKAGSEEADTVAIKKLAYFASTMGIVGIQGGMAANLYHGGISTPLKLVKYYSEKRFKKIDGVGPKQAFILAENVDDAIGSGVNIVQLATALSAFGPGIGYNKIQVVEDELGFENLKDLDEKTCISKIAKLHGFTSKTAKPIAENIKKLYKWIDASGLDIVEPEQVHVNNVLNGHRYLFTGFRSTELENWIKTHGGNIVSTVSACDTLIVKDPTSNSSKVLSAKAKGINIMSAADFIKNVVNAAN